MCRKTTVLLDKASNDNCHHRCEETQNPGQYTLRGGIIDIFAVNESSPFRIEFWGDEIDSLREFDIETQRSTEKTKSITIFPATEFVLEDTIENIIKRIYIILILIKSVTRKFRLREFFYI